MRKSQFYNRYVKQFILMFIDIACTALACFASYWILTEDNSFGQPAIAIDFNKFIIYSCVCVALTVIMFFAFRLYDSLWKYAGIGELVRIIIATLSIFVINVLVIMISDILPYRWCYLFSLLQFFFTIITRYTYRIIRHWRQGKTFVFPNINDKIKNKIRVMIVGAGDACLNLINEMLNNESLNMIPVCLIDDDMNKLNKRIENVKIVGTRDQIPYMCAKYGIDKIIIAMPSVDAKEIAKIISICQDTKCQIQTVPGIFQLVKKEISVNNLRDVQVEDLLGRNPIVVNITEIEQSIDGKVVLVTGGGGSIGSELCRQIARCKPKMLIIVDIYENNAYDIEQELKTTSKDLNLVVLIASVRDKYKIETIFEKYHPDIVVHAAAHKHVPLMETSPNEAIKNNVFGTLNVAKAADKYKVKKFILISTDKAVNPTNIMGASKRICEMIVQTINKESKTEYVAVRFGNVLGSNGSVVPLFKKQIAAGGPVTVTDRNITRFFMTIPEAVSLILQASVYAKGGEIFVLDMGEPVKIYDLAVNLIRLSGYTPNVDVKIVCTGLRPGEKLYEELLMKEEGLKATPNKLIHIGKPIDLNEETFFKELDELYTAIYEESDNVREMVKNITGTYHPQSNSK